MLINFNCIGVNSAGDGGSSPTSVIGSKSSAGCSMIIADSVGIGAAASMGAAAASGAEAPENPTFRSAPSDGLPSWLTVKVRDKPVAWLCEIEIEPLLGAICGLGWIVMVTTPFSTDVLFAPPTAPVTVIHAHLM